MTLAHTTPRTVFPRRWGWLPWVLIPLLGFAWFWFWRAGLWTGGDSEHWEREINLGIWWRRRQMLSFAMMQLAFTVGRLAVGWSAHCAINAVSCAAGALALLILWRLLAGRPWTPLAFALVASAGFTTIFYGHIETYAQPVAALLLHLLAVQRTAQRRWPLWTLTATFSLVMAFHLVILYALPAVLWILGRELGRRGWRWSDARPALVAALPAVLVWAIVWFQLLGDGELVGPHFTAPPLELLRRPWLIFTNPMAPTKGMFILWDGGLAGLVGAGVLAAQARRGRRDPWLMDLTLYFFCFMIFFAVWNPDAGANDFDLFCFPWVVACLAAAWVVDTLPWRGMLTGAMLGVNAYLFITRTAVFADLPHRGSGTILFENALPAKGGLARLDDTFRLFPVNRCIPAGGHEVFGYIRPGQLVRRGFYLRPGETCQIRLDAAGMSVRMQAPGGGEGR